MDSLHSLLWQAMAIDRHIAQSIVADNCHRCTRLTIYFVRQCLSIDSIAHLLSPTISIDGYLTQSIISDNIYINGYLPQSIVANNIYRWIPYTIYYLRQYISMDTYHNLLSPTISIDRLPPASVVQAIDHCCVYCPGCYVLYEMHHI